VIAGFETWLNITAKYKEIMAGPGLWDFPKGSEIPAELLKPFGQLAREYNMTAVYPTFASISNVGIGGVEDVLTIYVMMGKMI
jgi:hypothetical protein